MAAFRIAPEFRPYSALMVLVTILNSAIASGLGINNLSFSDMSLSSIPSIR
jgi:hypothetical protein